MRVLSNHTTVRCKGQFFRYVFKICTISRAVAPCKLSNNYFVPKLRLGYALINAFHVIYTTVQIAQIHRNYISNGHLKLKKTNSAFCSLQWKNVRIERTFMRKFWVIQKWPRFENILRGCRKLWLTWTIFIQTTAMTKSCKERQQQEIRAEIVEIFDQQL